MMNKKKSNWIVGVLLCLAIVVFVVSMWQLLCIGQQYRLGSCGYEELAQTVVTQTPPEQPALQAAETTQPSKPQPLLQVDFQSLTQINPDTIAWLRGCDGEIDHPIVQGKNNKYYLRHLFDGTANENGTVFADSRNNADLQDENTFIYGHNMNNGAMFAALLHYRTQGYYDEHRELILVTPRQSFYLWPFSGYVTAADSDAYTISFEEEDSFGDYLEKICARSEFVSSVTVTPQDRIVTLSTCAYDFDEARYVLHCKLVLAQ